MIELLSLIMPVGGTLAAFILYSKQNILLLTTISASIVEIIAGLFFWLYSHSLKQLNICQMRLGSTEKYLISLKLIDKMSDNIRDEKYGFLMESILIDNRLQVNEKLTEN